MTDTRNGPEKTALTLKEAHALLAAARPAAVLSLLKNPEFAMIAAIAFMGFRTDARSYANPLVRRRLAEEAARNADFAQKLRDLAPEAKVISAPSEPKLAKPQPRPLPSPTSAPPDTGEKYRAERDRLKQERDLALEARRKAESDYGKARTDQLAAQTAKGEAEREAERLRQRLERSERRLRRLEAENAALRRAAVGSIPESSSSTASGDERMSRPALTARNAKDSERRFAAAVRNLLDKEKWTLAAQIASDVLRTSPDDPDALAIRAHAEEGQGHIKEALADLRKLVPAEIAQGEIGRAAQSLAHLLVLSSRPASEGRLIRELYIALASKPSEMEGARDAIERTRATTPHVYDLLKDYAQDDIARRLFGPPQAATFAPDDPLPLSPGPLHGLTMTSRRLIGAIDRNDLALIGAAREAMRGLGEETLQQIARALRNTSKGDESYFQLLSRNGLGGAVVVDASNVAWHGQEMVVGGKPRLSHMLALRAALRERGFFPIVMIADANLPFVADEPARVRQMERDGELTLTTSGTDADEYILREARRLHALVVSNDYMADWDPEQSVRKVQYDISLVDGRATLYL